MKHSSFLMTAILFVFLTGSISTQAQYKGGRGGEGPVQVGSTILNLGIGVGSDYGNYYYNSAFGMKAALEFGLWQAGPGVVTLGPEMGGSWSTGGYNNGYKAHSFIVAARSAWHCGWGVPGLDTYGGVSLGFGFRHQDYVNGNDVPYSHTEVFPAPGIFVGASYFVTPGFGFNAEAGYDITSLQLGVVFKLN